MAHGNALPNATTSCTPGISTPYWAYTQPTFPSPPHPTFPPPPHPPTSSKSYKIRKTMHCPCEHVQERQRQSKGGKVGYTAITQVVVSLTASQCHVSAVAELVTQQVGFEGLLYTWQQMLSSFVEWSYFWTWLGRVPEKYLQHQKPFMKRWPSYLLMILWALRRPLTSLTKRLDHLTRSSGLNRRKIRYRSHVFECCIWKMVSKTPVVSPCCQRVIGCQSWH